MIYAHSSGFTSKEEIVRRIAGCDETPDAIRHLKEQLQSNYQKFFKESFKDRDFQAKWESLEKIRHKVAHNNLFTQADLDSGKALASELKETIYEAGEAINAIALAVEEKDAIRESFVSQGYLDVIGEEQFLSELKNREDYYHATGGFVGLAHFIKQHLGAKGYEYGSSFSLASQLNDQGKVEIYHVENPGSEFATAAIRTSAATRRTNGQGIIESTDTTPG
jgi:hypothetical protein